MIPQRFQRTRAKGYMMPPHTKSVARPSRFGNPFQGFKIGGHLACKLFDMWIYGEDVRAWATENLNGDGRLAIIMEVLEALGHGMHLAMMAQDELRGWNLACFCTPEEPCHADTLLKVANLSASPRRAPERLLPRRAKGTPCPECGNPLVHEEGCAKCYSCGFSKC